jgi:hypothetical protein
MRFQQDHVAMHGARKLGLRRRRRSVAASGRGCCEDTHCAAVLSGSRGSAQVIWMMTARPLQHL